MEKSNMSEREKKIFEAGVATGIKIMEDKIVQQYELGRPVTAKGRLWWLLSDIDNMNLMMDDIQTEWEEEHGISWKDEYVGNE